MVRKGTCYRAPSPTDTSPYARIFEGILKNISPLPKSSPAASVDLDRTVILPLFVPLLGVNLITASTTAYSIASKPVRCLFLGHYLLADIHTSPPHPAISHANHCLPNPRITLISNPFGAELCANHSFMVTFASIPNDLSSSALFTLHRRTRFHPNFDTYQNQTTNQRMKRSWKGSRPSY